MGAYKGHVDNIKNNIELNVNDFAGAYERLATAGVGFKGLLDQFGNNAAIEAKTGTTVNFVNVSTRRPVYLKKDERFAALTTAPTALTISGGAGTKYAYADLGVEDADGLSLVTLVQSTTAPDSETTAYRAYLGEVDFDSVSIKSVKSHYGLTKGGLWVAGESDAEATTTSTTVVDIKTVTLATPIGLGEGLIVIANLRKTAGAAVAASVGLKLNTTAVWTAAGWSGSANAAEQGSIWAFFWQQTTNYMRGCFGVTTSESTPAFRGNNVNMPNQPITSVTITGLVGNAAVTMGVADLVVYRLGVG